MNHWDWVRLVVGGHYGPIPLHTECSCHMVRSIMIMAPSNIRCNRRQDALAGGSVLLSCFAISLDCTNDSAGGGFIGS